MDRRTSVISIGFKWRRRSLIADLRLNMLNMETVDDIKAPIKI